MHVLQQPLHRPAPEQAGASLRRFGPARGAGPDPLLQEKCKVTSIVDVATLTGACMVALGTQIAGLFTPSDAMAAAVTAAAKAAGRPGAVVVVVRPLHAAPPSPLAP
jgi:hypothetical protein